MSLSLSRFSARGDSCSSGSASGTIETKILTTDGQKDRHYENNTKLFNIIHEQRPSIRKNSYTLSKHSKYQDLCEDSSMGTT